MHDVNVGESARSSTTDFHASNASIVRWPLEHPASPSDKKTLHFCLHRVQCSLQFLCFLGHIFFIHLLLQTYYIVNYWSLQKCILCKLRLSKGNSLLENFVGQRQLWLNSFLDDVCFDVSFFSNSLFPTNHTQRKLEHI